MIMKYPHYYLIIKIMEYPHGATDIRWVFVTHEAVGQMEYSHTCTCALDMVLAMPM